MLDRPIQKAGESHLKYLYRVREWELAMKPVMDKDARAIDRALAKSKISHNRAVTRQVEVDRETIHDRCLASTNAVTIAMYKRVAKRLQEQSARVGKESEYVSEI